MTQPQTGLCCAYQVFLSKNYQLREVNHPVTLYYFFLFRYVLVLNSYLLLPPANFPKSIRPGWNSSRLCQYPVIKHETVDVILQRTRFLSLDIELRDQDCIEERLNIKSSSLIKFQVGKQDILWGIQRHVFLFSYYTGNFGSF